MVPMTDIAPTPPPEPIPPSVILRQDITTDREVPTVDIGRRAWGVDVAELEPAKKIGKS